MTKKQKMIQRKNIRNYLPKYDLGTSLNNTQTGPYQMTQQIGQGVAEKGRQTGNQYVTTARQDEQGANLSGKAGAYNRSTTSSALLLIMLLAMVLLLLLVFWDQEQVPLVQEYSVLVKVYTMLLLLLISLIHLLFPIANLMQ